MSFFRRSHGAASRWMQDASFAIIPILYMVINVLLACTVSLVTKTEEDGLIEAALRMNNMVSAAAITIVTLTFSLTVLSLQIASQMYSPRLLDDFLKDPVAVVVISVNLGAYAFCYTLQYFLDDGGSGLQPVDVPYVSIHLLSVHMALILVTFVSFINIFINGFRVEKILSRAAESSLRAAQAFSNEAETHYWYKTSASTLMSSCAVVPTPPSDSYKVLADTSGYVDRFQMRNVVHLAEQLDVRVRYCYQIGEFVNEGTILCYIWDAKTKDKYNDVALDQRVVDLVNGDKANKTEPGEHEVERKLGMVAAKGIHISKFRSRDLDLTLGIQQQCDVAVRALSPAVNDPHTAIQSLDTLSGLFTSLGLMELGVPCAPDRHGYVRVFAPRRSFSFLLSLLDTIRSYGASDLEVCRRGLRLFADLATVLMRAKRLDRVAPALAQLKQWMIASRESFAEGSPELQNLQELYDHLLETIYESQDLLLKERTTKRSSFQFLNTTLKETDSQEFHRSFLDSEAIKTFMRSLKSGHSLMTTNEDAGLSPEGHDSTEFVNSVLETNPELFHRDGGKAIMHFVESLESAGTLTTGGSTRPRLLLDERTACTLPSLDEDEVEKKDERDRVFTDAQDYH